MSRTDKTRQITGRHVLLVAVAFFGVVFGANMALVVAATGSFPGLVVKNSYVESQLWNDRKAAAEALGWDATVGYGEGRIRVEIAGPEGAAVEDAALVAIVGRPAQAETDRRLVLAPVDGGYEARIALAPGNWRAAIETVQGPDFAVTAKLYVAEPRVAGQAAD